MTIPFRIALLAATLLAAACAPMPEAPAPAEESAPAAEPTNEYGLVLSPDDQRIWDTLTPEQQARAAQYIKNGGTLVASLSED